MTRTESVHAQVAALVVPYARMYGTLTPEIQALHASPERLHAAIVANDNRYVLKREWNLARGVIALFISGISIAVSAIGVVLSNMNNK